MRAPILETERLTLRGHRLDDFGPYAAMWADPVVTQHIGGKPIPEEESWTRFLRQAGHWALLGFGYWVVEEKANAGNRLDTRSPISRQGLRHRGRSRRSRMGRTPLPRIPNGLHHPSCQPRVHSCSGEMRLPGAAADNMQGPTNNPLHPRPANVGWAFQPADTLSSVSTSRKAGIQRLFDHLYKP
jgi:hypothetical protein